MEFDSWIAGFRGAGGALGFGIPGGGASLKVVEALQQAGGRFVVPGHEQTAALMAGGAFAVSGMPALCTTIKGPGFASLLPGHLCCAYEGYATLSLCEAYPGQSAGQRRHKWLNHRSLLNELPGRAGAFEPGGFERAWRNALRETPGPVLLDLAAGDLLPSASDPGPASAQLDEILIRISRAARPILIAGGLSRRSSWGKFLASCTVPVFTTPAAKGVLSETSACSAGIYTAAGTALTPEANLLPRADLVVLLGVRHGELLGPVVHENQLWLDSSHLALAFPPEPSGEHVHRLDSEQFSQVVELLGEKKWGEELVGESRARLQSAFSDTGWTPASLASVLSSHENQSVHVLDTGNFTVLAEHLLPAGPQRRVIGTPNSRWMGAGVGLALGAAFASSAGLSNQEETILWIGDGGFRASGLELRLAAASRLPLLTLVLSDGYFGSVRGRVTNPDLREGTLRLEPLDLEAFSSAIGLRHKRVRNPGDLGDLLKEWRQNRLPTVAVCEFDPELYERAGNLVR